MSLDSGYLRALCIDLCLPQGSAWERIVAGGALWWHLPLRSHAEITNFRMHGVLLLRVTVAASVTAFISYLANPSLVAWSPRKLLKQLKASVSQHIAPLP